MQNRKKLSKLRLRLSQTICRMQIFETHVGLVKKLT